ncbi:MAG: FAD-dependent oxidoreductase [Rubellimicrobium sp.]|nr:FAD-dependent oxidoreductase [Rubellimicrobium sp.]
MEQLKVDLCIIGAGSAGLSAAAGAAQMGASVVLIEGGQMGGDCLNTGCVPSKALLAAAKRAHAMEMGAALGVSTTGPVVDFAAVKDHVARTIATIAPMDSQERFEGMGVRVIRDWGRFVARDRVQAGEVEVTARRFVIATGSRPRIPKVPGIETVDVLTNETIFDLRTRPEHLIVLGGGPIGIEMAQAHRRLGSAVTVIEAARALGAEDEAPAAMLIAQLRAEGVTILEGAQAARIFPAEDGGDAGQIVVETSDGLVTGSHLLVATGREVVLDSLGLDAGGVAHDARGIRVDASLRSLTNRRVFAAGDAAGGLMFTHVAGYHAGVIVRRAMFGLPARAGTAHIPRVTYTDPELAHVGLTEAEARRRHGAAIEVFEVGFEHNDRAVAEGRATGMARVIVLRGRPVGATILGPGAGELIGIWALALSARLKMSAIAGMVLPYPTLSEINKRLASAYFSPRLFNSPAVRRVVEAVQRWLP